MAIAHESIDPVMIKAIRLICAALIAVVVAFAPQAPDAALGINNKSGFGVYQIADAGVLSVTFLDNQSDTTNQSSYSYASMNFGAAAANRYIVAVFGAAEDSGGTGLATSSVTIGGVSATLLREDGHDAGGDTAVSIYIALVPTGTSGTVAITYAAGRRNAGVALYRLTGLNSTIAVDTASNTADPMTDTIDVNDGGVVIAGAMTRSNVGATNTWTGVTQPGNVSDEIGNGDVLYASFEASLGSETGRTITANLSAAGSSEVMTAVSLR